MSGENPLPPAQVKSIQDALRAFVTRHDGSQTEAARVLGVSQGHVSSVLSGKRGAGVDMIMQLARALERTTDGILGLEDASEDPELAAALNGGDWPDWVRDAASSRRNLHGTMKREQWAGWMRGLMAADSVVTAALGPSAQEQAFDRKRTKSRTTARKRG